MEEVRSRLASACFGGFLRKMKIAAKMSQQIRIPPSVVSERVVGFEVDVAVSSQERAIFTTMVSPGIGVLIPIAVFLPELRILTLRPLRFKIFRVLSTTSKILKSQSSQR
jgi:hypothetical protein